MGNLRTVLNETYYIGLWWEENHKIFQGLQHKGQKRLERTRGERCYKKVWRELFARRAVNCRGRISHLQSPWEGTVEINAPYPHSPASTENQQTAGEKVWYKPQVNLLGPEQDGEWSTQGRNMDNIEPNKYKSVFVFANGRNHCVSEVVVLH